MSSGQRFCEMDGVVVRSTGSWYTVLTSTGQRLDCKVKGSFRLQGIRSTNPVAVGDHVTITTTADGTALITHIADRKNYIIRRSQNLSKHSHILAANVDLALLIVTVSHPETSLVFVDRFLASAEAYAVPVLLVFNKLDLLTLDERHIQDNIISIYRNAGYPCIALSAHTGEGLDKLMTHLTGKVSVLAGNSGVGKSTLINRLIPTAHLATGALSTAYDLGTHTTTFSEMLEVTIGGVWSALIDTPGIKGFGTLDMKPQEISHYFPDIFRLAKECKFHNCTHTHEPACAVMAALDNHLLAPSRYRSYLSMLAEDATDKYRPPQG